MNTLFDVNYINSFAAKIVYKKGLSVSVKTSQSIMSYRFTNKFEEKKLYKIEIYNFINAPLAMNIIVFVQDVLINFRGHKHILSTFFTFQHFLHLHNYKTFNLC